MLILDLTAAVDIQALDYAVVDTQIPAVSIP